MSKEAIYWAKTNSAWRRSLKARLIAKWGDRCPITGLEACDLAEVLVWRSDYPFPSKQRLIFVEENCVPVHHSVNMDQSRENTEKLARILVARVGIVGIRKWLADVDLKPRVSLEDL